MEEQNLIISEELKRDLWRIPVDIELITDANLSDAALRLYLRLMGYARMNTTAFPGRDTLANEIHYSVRQIDKLKNELKELGLLDWTQSIGKDGRLHNTYTLLKYKPIKKQTKEEIFTRDQPCPSHETSHARHTGTAVLDNNTNSNNTNNKNLPPSEALSIKTYKDNLMRQLNLEDGPANIAKTAV
jgi:predicted transcriptional regulator